MGPVKCRILPDSADGHLQDLVEPANAYIRTKVEHPFRVI